MKTIPERTDITETDLELLSPPMQALILRCNRRTHATTALQTRAQSFEASCHGGQTDGRKDGNGRAGGGIRRVYVSASSCREMLKCLWSRVRRVTRLTATLQKGPRSLHFPHAAGDLLSKHPWFLWVHAWEAGFEIFILSNNYIIN
jgi:hypothetical protein